MVSLNYTSPVGTRIMSDLEHHQSPFLYTFVYTYISFLQFSVRSFILRYFRGIRSNLNVTFFSLFLCAPALKIYCNSMSLPKSYLTTAPSHLLPIVSTYTTEFYNVMTFQLSLQPFFTI